MTKKAMCHVLFLAPFIGLVLFWVLPLEQATLIYSLVVVTSGIFIWLIWGDSRGSAATGAEAVIGSEAEVIRSSSGQSKVAFRGGMWDAVSHGDLSAGQTVRITAVKRMKLSVEPINQAASVGETIRSEK